MMAGEESIIFEELKQGNEQLEWLTKHYEELRKRYKNRYVAIKDKKIVMDDSDIERLIKRLQQEHYNLQDITIEFMPDDDFIMVI